MAALSWYKWHWQDWRANRRVQRMPWQAKGPYRELLDEFWSEGSLPTFMSDLADIVGCSEEEMAELWPHIAPCFEERDGRLYNAKMDEQRTGKDAERVKRANAGRLGGLACNSLTRAKEPEALVEQTQASAKQVEASADIEEKRREEKRGAPRGASASADLDDEAQALARRVQCDLGLSGMFSESAIKAQALVELKSGAEFEPLVDRMMAAWSEYQARKPDLLHHWSAEKFFGESHWRKPAAWKAKNPAKVEKQPEPKPRKSAAELIAEQEGN